MITPGCENEKKKIYIYICMYIYRERETEVEVEMYRIAPIPFPWLIEGQSGKNPLLLQKSSAKEINSSVTLIGYTSQLVLFYKKFL